MSRARVLVMGLVGVLCAVVVVAQPPPAELHATPVMTFADDPELGKQWYLGGGYNTWDRRGIRAQDAWDDSWHILAYQNQPGYVRDDGQGRRLVRMGNYGGSWLYRLVTGDFTCAFPRCEVAHGWGYSAAEDEPFRVPQLPGRPNMVVRFGTDDKWIYRYLPARDDYRCNLGGLFPQGGGWDPVPGRKKFCQVQLDEAGTRFLGMDGDPWTWLPAKTLVRYGNIDKWTYKYLPQGGGGQCNQAFFNNVNPYPELPKHCEVVKSMGAGTTIAVVDSGSWDHEDLRGKWLPGLNLNALPKGWPDNPQLAPPPVDRLTDTTITWDDRARPAPGTGCHAKSDPWHAVEIAGTAAANTFNKTGIAGVAPFAKLLPIKSEDCWQGSAPPGHTALGIRWAAGQPLPGYPPNGYGNPNPADVILMAWNNYAPCPESLQSAINYALSRDVVIVAVAGQSDDPTIDGQLLAAPQDYYPANCSGVIVVTASDPDNRRPSDANYGGPTKLAAPGVGMRMSTVEPLRQVIGQTAYGPIISPYLVPQDTYGVGDGTSSSAAVVAGIVALMKGKNSRLTESNIFYRLQLSATATPACTGCGAGVVDAYRAVRSAEAITDETEPNDTAPNANYISAAADVAGNIAIKTNVCVVESQCGQTVFTKSQPDVDHFALDLLPHRAMELSFESGSCPLCFYQVNDEPRRPLSQTIQVENNDTTATRITIKVTAPPDLPQSTSTSYLLLARF